MKKSITPYISVIWDSMRNSFWFLPGILACLAVILHVMVFWLDHYWPHPAFYNGIFLYHGDPDSARQLLSTLATSMITLAGVLFSITIVVLALASSQLGPRLIRNFMGDIATQWVLGCFVATFIYCILSLRNISATQQGYTPNFTISFSIILAIINSGVLIFFINHISVSIQADQIINDVTLQTKKAIENINNHKKAKPSSHLQKSYNHKTMVKSTACGYLQSIDINKLKHLACEVDGLLTLICKPGDYLLAGSSLLCATHNGNLSPDFPKRTRAAFVFGKVRTPLQDIEFSVDQIVQIALRALSPSLNDPFTAITCIDKLSAIVHLFGEAAPDGHVYDSVGNLRLKLDVVTFEGIVDAAFVKIRQAGQDHPAIVIRLLERIHDIVQRLNNESHKRTLIHLVKDLHENMKLKTFIQRDRADMERRIHAILAT